MAKHIDPALKNEILRAIKDGMNISDASSKYHVSDNTLYTWLRIQADNTGTSALEIAKLRKENQELKEIRGFYKTRCVKFLKPSLKKNYQKINSKLPI